MSPIFVRPVREQIEHDRLIRFLQTKYKRKGELGVNVGDEKVAPVKLGQNTYFPDLVLSDGRKLIGLVEVESGESVNYLEAMSQWVHFAKARVPFHLYVPVQAFEAARRLCEAYKARVSEVWTYRSAPDGFDLIRMSHDPSAPGHLLGKATPAKAPPRKAPGKKVVKKVAKAVVKKPAKKAAPAKTAKKKPAPRRSVAKPKKAGRKK